VREGEPVDEHLQALARARRRRAERWRRRVRWALLFVTSLVLANAIAGENGLLDQIRHRRDHAVLARQIDRLREENDRLRDEARRLREDPGTIEAVARRELGLVKPGERPVIVAPAGAPRR
jgi:cell division protein FtsB